MASHRFPSSSRTGRLIGLLHAAGTEGMTISGLAAELDLKPYEVKEILNKLKSKQPAQAIPIGLCRTPDRRKPDERWACSCRLGHKPRDTPAGRVEFRPLTDEEKERGHAGVAACRQILEDINARRRAS
ncbi:MAG TPA: hypothetical protein VHC63_13480 [Acidimicrobiales bacterium]|nr:hypothetical protein [Acidimicrobiales bacterium]